MTNNSHAADDVGQDRIAVSIIAAAIDGGYDFRERSTGGG